MQLEEILSELENNTGKFPHLALEKAIEERSAITPLLLETLEKFSNNLEELLDKDRHRNQLKIKPRKRKRCKNNLGEKIVKRKNE
jgi:hypothetical protein